MQQVRLLSRVEGLLPAVPVRCGVAPQGLHARWRACVRCAQWPPCRAEVLCGHSVSDARSCGRRGRLSHDNFNSRCRGLRACGENVLYNYDKSSNRGKAAMRQWYNSPPHRRNMLSRSYNRVGLAYVNCRRRFYWTAFYAKK